MRHYASSAERQAAYRRRRQEAVASERTQRGLPLLPIIPTIPGTVRWRAAIQSALSILSAVVDEMENYYDDRTERWKEGERGETLQDNLQALRDVIDGLEQLEI
jgi:hypothetical protein